MRRPTSWLLTAILCLTPGCDRSSPSDPASSADPAASPPTARTLAFVPATHGPAAGLRPGDLVTNSIGMKLAYIPPGQFMMGSPANDPERADDETQHAVTLTKGFYMATTAVTQAQWRAVMGTTLAQQRDIANKSFPLKGDGDDFPMYYLSWDDAVAFCKKLGAKEGKSYRLPTEAEWEYACRAGTTAAYGTGNDETALAGEDWYAGNSGLRAHPVGLKPANGWGLYDTHGNVVQWCSDWYGAYPEGDVTDPAGPPTGINRVIRGGSWDFGPRYCRAGNRRRIKPENRYNDSVGFRVVEDLPR